MGSKYLSVCLFGFLAAAAAFSAGAQELAQAGETNEAAAMNASATPALLGASVGDIARIQEERLLIKAKLDLATIKQEFAARGAESDKVIKSYAPVVKSIQGTGTNLYATFVYPGNTTMDGKRGDVIGGGFTVEFVSVDQVVLSKNGEKVRLGFSASPPTPIPARDMSPHGGAPFMVPSSIR